MWCSKNRLKNLNIRFSTKPLSKYFKTWNKFQIFKLLYRLRHLVFTYIINMFVINDNLVNSLYILYRDDSHFTRVNSITVPWHPTTWVSESHYYRLHRIHQWPVHFGRQRLKRLGRRPTSRRTTWSTLCTTSTPLPHRTCDWASWLPNTTA